MGELVAHIQHQHELLQQLGVPAPRLESPVGLLLLQVNPMCDAAGARGSCYVGLTLCPPCPPFLAALRARPTAGSGTALRPPRAAASRSASRA